MGIKANITTFNNYGTINGTPNPSYQGSLYASIRGSTGTTIDTLNNYGTMAGISQITISTLNNYGTITYAKVTNEYGHLYSSGNIINIGNYHININTDSDSFNKYSNSAGVIKDNDRESHLISNSNNVKLKNKDSKFILSFGDKFQFNTNYQLDKLVLLGGNLEYADGTLVSDLFSHLTTYNNGLFELYQGANNTFGARLGDTSYSAANTLYKSTILSINTLSSKIDNSIYQRYSTKSQSIKTSYESPQNQYAQSSQFPIIKVANNTKAQRQQSRQYLAPQKQQSTQTTNTQSQQMANKHHFFFTPFVSHQLLYSSNGGGYGGLSYGFVSGYNAYATNKDLVGFHFGFSYGGIESAKDNITQLDTNSYAGVLGVHYKREFSDRMYLKSKIDAFYYYHTLNGHFNDVKNIKTINPQSIAGSVSANFGREWGDRAKLGALRLEGGVSYLGVYNTALEHLAESYSANFLNLFYGDINANHQVLLGKGSEWVLDSTLGAKVLLTPLPQVNLNVAGTHKIDISENRIQAYANLGVAYRINDIVALELSYMGIFGDKSMSNSGFFSTKVWW